MVIAQRTLKLRKGTGDVEVPICIFRPKDDDGMWICHYEIDWPAGKQTGKGAGVDSVQALVTALQGVAALIYTSDYHEAGALSWAKSMKGYGFPLPGSMRDLLVGEDVTFL